MLGQLSTLAPAHRARCRHPSLSTPNPSFRRCTAWSPKFGAWQAKRYSQCFGMSTGAKSKAFEKIDEAKGKFSELDGGDYAAMLVDKDYNEVKYYGSRGKVQTEMEEYWKQHFKGSRALDKIKKNQSKEAPTTEVKVKEYALDDSLAELRRDHWVSEEERAEPVVFRWELDETRTKIDKCLCGDLFLPSPEKDKIGFLAISLARFDTVTLKRDRAEGTVISVNRESRVCKVVFPDRETSKRVGYQTLSSLTFSRRKAKEASLQLRAQDFLPPEEGDTHMPASKQGEELLEVKEVWEDDETGNFHWTYGDEKVNARAPATSCDPDGKVVVPFRATPTAEVQEMLKQSEEVAATMANVAELSELVTGKRRQQAAKRGAVCADPQRIRKRRPRVEVKCTGQAFLCKPGSRLGLLSTTVQKVWLWLWLICGIKASLSPKLDEVPVA
ncbi:unnamed protein product [Symbiodinium natans]|uniref:Uncharacterized protein n=1 Tax=Symbiodinium natans TaxID=878477 RepID=A0A812QD44_9DINO|nr:unnamed protein product [Symbiodinium natans]